jgi:hypothetical protein
VRSLLERALLLGIWMREEVPFKKTSLVVPWLD